MPIDGANLETRYGSAITPGDGDQYAMSGNIGLPLTSNGFANFSFEYGETDPTDRSVQRDDAAALDRGRQYCRQESGTDLGHARAPGRSEDFVQFRRRPL